MISYHYRRHHLFYFFVCSLASMLSWGLSSPFPCNHISPLRISLRGSFRTLRGVYLSMPVLLS